MSPLVPLVTGLGIQQIISWGALFYAVGVFGPAMARDLGLPEQLVFGAYTGGLLVSAALAPLAGRLIDARGGRFVLAVGSAIAAFGLALLAAASHPAMVVAGWLVCGAAMAASLYDPAFAALAQHAGSQYRKAVGWLTIFGGFASTVFWPLTHVLMEAAGWRAAVGIYALLHVVACLPIHLLIVPRTRPRDALGAREREAAPARPGFAWLNAAFALASLVAAAVAIQMVGILGSAGLTPGEAVGLAVLMGPSQVFGRLVEIAFASRLRVLTVATAGFASLVTAFGLLFLVDGMGPAAVAFVVVFGIGNGLLTIARGTVPAELYGREGLGAVLGRLASVSLFSRAIAPATFSAIIAGAGRTGGLGAFAALAVLSIACFGFAVKSARGR